MSTKLNGEDIAAKRYPRGFHIGQWTPQDGYAAAIREVAQPLADERDELKAEVERLRGTTGHETVPKQAFDELWDALERATDRLESVLSGKVVRDADETISEARSVLAKYPRP